MDNQMLLDMGVDPDEFPPDIAEEMERVYQENCRLERERIGELEKIRRMPWISVKTSLPEKGGDWVLITNGKEIGYGFQLDESWGWIKCFNKELTLTERMHLSVTHWMPADHLLLYLPALELSA